MQELITVVMPSFNSAYYIGRAINSVLEQDYKNLELIIVDNNSSDNTDKVVKNFNDKRLNYYKINNDGIIAKSRNYGIKKSNGLWIAFLDSDDYWKINKISICSEHMNQKNDVIYHNLINIYEKNGYEYQKKNKSQKLIKPILSDLMVKGNQICTSSIIVRRKILLEVNGMSEEKQIVGAEDYDTWMRIAKITNNFCYIPKYLGFYQVHKLSKSNLIDMSVPTSLVMMKYFNCLTTKEKEKAQANIIYIKNRFKYLSGTNEKINYSFINCLKYGNFSIKIKTLYMLIMIIACRTLKKITKIKSK